jgi:methyl-accepting chemotaxis protein
MSLANLKIGVRLGIGFGVVLTLLTAMMLLGLASMSRIGSRTQDILSDKNVKMAAVRSMVGDVRTVTLALTTMVVVPSPEQMNAELAKVEEARARYRQSREKLAAMMTEEKEKSLLAAVDDALKSGADINNRLVQLRKDGDIPAATDYLLKETGPVQAKALAALNDVFTYETRLMEEAGSDVQAVYSNGRIMQLVLGTIAMAVGISVAWFITRSITGPLNRAVTVAETVASGDLTSRIDAEGQDETARLLLALKKMNDALLGVVGEVRAGTDAITTASHEIAAGNMDLSSRTEQQASSLEETVSSMEQLTSTVRQNADNARQANTLAHSASEVASRGGAIVSQVVDTMGAINTSSGKIAERGRGSGPRR